MAPCVGRGGRSTEPRGRHPTGGGSCAWGWGGPCKGGQHCGTHRGVGAGEEHAQAEEPQQRPPHHAEDADGCLQGHGTAVGLQGWGGHPHPGGQQGAPHPLPAARGPAWRTGRPSPGTAARSRELGERRGCHSTAAPPPVPPARPPLTQQLGELRGPRLRQPGAVRPHQVLHRHRRQRVEGGGDGAGEESEREGGSATRPPPPALGHGTHLREPLNRQATKRPGSPGRSFSTSITKYSTSWGPARGERGAGGRTAGWGGRRGHGQPPGRTRRRSPAGAHGRRRT